MLQTVLEQKLLSSYCSNNSKPTDLESNYFFLESHNCGKLNLLVIKLISFTTENDYILTAIISSIN